MAFDNKPIIGPTTPNSIEKSSNKQEINSVLTKNSSRKDVVNNDPVQQNQKPQEELKANVQVQELQKDNKLIKESNSDAQNVAEVISYIGDISGISNGLDNLSNSASNAIDKVTPKYLKPVNLSDNSMHVVDDMYKNDKYKESPKYINLKKEFEKFAVETERCTEYVTTLTLINDYKTAVAKNTPEGDKEALVKAKELFNAVIGPPGYEKLNLSSQEFNQFRQAFHPSNEHLQTVNNISPLIQIAEDTSIRFVGSQFDRFRFTDEGKEALNMNSMEASVKLKKEEFSVNHPKVSNAASNVGKAFKKIGDLAVKLDPDG
jgi:hypothetical protein